MRPVLPLSILKRATALVLILHLTGGTASARTWTTVTGENFEAEFVRAEGANGIFKVKEKDYPYPLNRLSVPDRLFIGRIVNRQAGEGAAPPASSATPLPAGLTNPESTASAVSEQTPAAPAKSDAQVELAGQALKPGGSVEMDIPILDPEGQREMQRAYSRLSSKARSSLQCRKDSSLLESHTRY